MRLVVPLLRTFTLVAVVLFISINAVNAAEPVCGPPKGEIPRAVFTTEVKDREPVNQVLILNTTSTKVYFFTELRHFQGQEITHRWEHNGKVVSQKNFSVKGPRWRVYSAIDLDKSMTGRWTVVVTNQKGCPIKASVFEYVEAGTGNGKQVIINLAAPR